VVETLGLKRIVLVGHSLGGELAIRLTAKHPSLVSGLVIIDFGPELNPEATTRIRNDFIADSRIYAGYNEYASRLEERQPMISSRRRLALAMSALRPRDEGGFELNRDPAMGSGRLESDGALPPLWPMLDSIRCPALVIRGLGSAVLSASVARRTVDALSNGSLSSIRLAGHGVMLENPEDFAAAVFSFLREKMSLGRDALCTPSE
jgi:pimeloyl-ACP methyl ester carboxylesterase